MSIVERRRRSIVFPVGVIVLALFGMGVATSMRGLPVSGRDFAWLSFAVAIPFAAAVAALNHQGAKADSVGAHLCRVVGVGSLVTGILPLILNARGLGGPHWIAAALVALSLYSATTRS